jgi:two-component system response regulator YesN
MLNVLLVDDEPFILQGLQVLIDWKSEGYIIATASNGLEALEYIKANPVDLIIADIKMPVMTGIELLKELRTTLKKDTYFVFLSGFAEFAYAREALRYDCTDYILKPVEKDQLLEILHKVSEMNSQRVSEYAERQKNEKAFLDRNLIFLLSGKFDDSNLRYLEDKINIDDEMCYVDIQLSDSDLTEESSDEDRKGKLKKLYASATEFLKEDAKLCIMDISDSESVYNIGLIYCSEMGKRLQLTTEEYLSKLHEYISGCTGVKSTMLVGKNVTGISNISKSYGTANILRSLQGFREPKGIYYYEKEYQVSDSGVLICKEELDRLIDAIEIGDRVQIHKRVDEFFDALQSNKVTGDAMNLNINYLLFQLMHIASQQDSEVNQEEILRIISETTINEGVNPGSRAHILKMAYAYGEYLSQLRKNVSKPVLKSVEDEIKKNFAQNLTLKDLSEKYFVNSAYLGQLFRKNYGCSFKDYLNRQRIEEAAKLLLKTDMKIYEVADAVGYKDVDYFVNKFIEAKGCTPTKYKKK